MSKQKRLPFRYLEPAFLGGLFDDPLLFLRIRPLRRALLFDCGQIAHLAKRVVKPITTVFITHAHMDHSMGIPTLVRHHHASPKPLDIYGPPEIAERIHHLLSGFDWNLCEPTWFTLRVHEIHQEEIRHYSFSGPEGFPCRFDGVEPRNGQVIWSCRYLSVSAKLLDHKLPVLAFRIEERPAFSVNPLRMEQLGLVTGEWLNDLKRRVWQGESDRVVLATTQAGDGAASPVADPQALYAAISAERPAAALGYLCDVGWSAENVAKIENFLGGVTLLCAESAFLAEDQAKARAAFHLCTTDLNMLMQQLKPPYLLAMHLSKSYLRRYAELYQELQPPPETTILPLPPHLVPTPISLDDVTPWLKKIKRRIPGEDAAPLNTQETPDQLQSLGHPLR